MEKVEINSSKKVSYVSPDIVVVEIEIEQNLLASGSAEGELPGMTGGPW